jgi:Family of unknown function (DUF6069)
MTATQSVNKEISTHRLAPVVAVAAGVIIAIGANSIDAFAAIAAGASSSFAPLWPAVYAPFSAIGVVAAFIGWSIIRRRSSRPAAVLRVLVPVLAVLSFVPDAVLLATGFIPGASLTAVLALAIMHVVVVAVAVPLCLRLAPVR